MDYRLRFHHRFIVHLRAFPGGNRLEHSSTRVGYPRFSRWFHGRYHERARGRGDAPQSISPFRGHPKPPMEYTGRQNHQEATTLRVCRHDSFHVDRLGHQQRHDPVGRRRIFRD